MLHTCRCSHFSLSQGYNGSQLWDTAFAMQAFAASRLSETLPVDAAAQAAASSSSNSSSSPSPSGRGAGAMAVLARSNSAGNKAKLAERLEEMAARAFSYFDASQIKEDVPQRTRFFRTISKGGWPFSTNGVYCARCRKGTKSI